MIRPEELGDLRNAARYANALPAIEEDIQQMQNGVSRKVMQALDAGTLTPEQALVYWTEWAGYHKLLTKFQTRVKIATSSAENAASTLTR